MPSTNETNSVIPRPFVKNDAPEPPRDLFRIIKNLSPHSVRNGVYLCLPRKLTTEPTISNRPAIERATRAIRPLRPNPYQLGIPCATTSTISSNGRSSLPSDLVPELSQLLVVKTYPNNKVLRQELALLEHLHNDPLCSLHAISSIIKSVEIAPPLHPSYICLEPTFGPTLSLLLQRLKNTEMALPSYLLAHVFLGVFSALRFLHRNDIAHGNLHEDHVMLNMYPRCISHSHHPYRGWPEVQILGFSNAVQSIDEAGKKDVAALLHVLKRMIGKESEVSMWHTSAASQPGLDAEVLVEANLDATRSLEDENAVLSLDRIDAVFVKKFEDMRKRGPWTLHEELLQTMHHDLLGEEELERALDETLVVLNFDVRKDEFLRMIGRMGVQTE